MTVLEQLELESDDHGLVECTCGHIGFVAEAGPDGRCINCCEEKTQPEIKTRSHDSIPLSSAWKEFRSQPNTPTSK